MKEPQKIAADKEEEAKSFFTTPLKLRPLKRSSLKSEEGHSPHIVFHQPSGRWVLKIDKP